MIADVERIVAALIRLYPTGFRHRFGEEMLATFREQRGAVGRGAPRLAIATIVGLLRGLPSAHARERRAMTSAAHALHLPPRTPMRHFASDLGHAARALAKQPLLAIVATLTLGLGIGANTAVFSVLNSVVLSPLPFAEPERLVRVHGARLSDPGEREFLTAPHIVEARSAVPALGAIAISYTYNAVGRDLMIDGLPDRIRVMPIGADYFATFGATPLLGRTFTRDEERAGIARVVLSHALWQRLTGGDRAVVGSSLTLDGEAFEVVGVMRPTFRDPLSGDVAAWTPQNLVLAGSNSLGNHFLTAVARLAPGATITEAHVQLDAMMGRMREPPNEDYTDDRTLRLVPLRDDLVGETSTAVFVLMGAAGLVLLIACLNVANLFLARGVAQGRELAIRTALGAARGRLIGQRMAESLVVAMVGGVLGSVVAFGGVKLLLAMSPASLARAEEVGFDPRLLGFALGITLLTALLFGAAPAVNASRVDPADALHEGGRGSVGGRGGRRMRSALVSSQVALALILLVGAVTLMRSFVELQRTDLGFDSDGVATFEVNLPAARYGAPESRARFHEEYLSALGSQPGIAAAGAASWLPGNGDYNTWGTRYLDREGAPQFLLTQIRVVEGEFFEAMRVPLQAGRVFEPTDRAGGERVIVLDAAYAERGFGDRDPIGGVVYINRHAHRVIGVVANAAVDVTGRRAPTAYLRHAQFAADRNWPLHYVVRTVGAPSDAVQAARATLVARDGALVVHRPRLYEALLGDHRARQRFTALLMTTFALVAATLAAVGLYGVLSYTVTQRRRELGVRMALGARSGQVRALVLRHAATMTGAGLLVGLAGALALSRVIESLVVGVSARDPLALLGVAAGLALVSLLAAFVPAWRATRVDPLEALRAD